MQIGRLVQNRSSECKKLPFFSYLLYNNLITVYTNIPKSFHYCKIKWAFSAMYRNGILHSELQILAKIQLGVICVQMVDYHRPGYKFNV